ncbi:hypothetical protein [Streptomyces sp. AS02]|uniref:hypothetical protein n=1 Tax=Streptomyces sp. AS02 TaxID=2938946 RepID=UPI0020201666|nr:hypothetical protein [Streptomyces sp. AS02]MCL8015217.1 hypothetical protein [Streptomyces sp. AS02]
MVADGRHDVFLPPRRVGPAAQRLLGTRLHVLGGSGRLVLDEATGRALAVSPGDAA